MGLPNAGIDARSIQIQKESKTMRIQRNVKSWGVVARIGAVAAGCIIGTVLFMGATKESLMRAKLKSAQDVLEGITLKDFEKVKDGAENLKVAVTLDQWINMEKSDVEYKRYSDNFRELVESLTKAAEDKNLQAATFRYGQIAASCVDCHEHLRDKK